jgi:signal transduction histidine kinase
MFLDSTDKNTPIGEIRNSLERARAAIDDHVVALADVTNFDGNSTLGEEVTKKVALWQGIMSVEVDLMPDVSILENPLAVHIAQIVEEALANASRHGNATSVGISLKRHDDSIVLVVNDNGSLIPVRKQGLGMAMVSQLSNGNYSLKASDSGTQLTVTLAIA